MNETGGGRLRRHVIWAVVVAFLAVLTPATATAAGPVAGHALRASASVTSSTTSLAAARGRTRLRGFDTRAARIRLGRDVEDDVVVLPRSRRAVLVQARGPGARHFATARLGSSTARGRFHAVYHPTIGGVWRFRLVVPATRTRAALISATRVVSVLDRTAPHGITQLAVSQVGTDSATLVWVDPADQDFNGVLIRRAVGSTAPASPTQGTRVTDTDRKATQFADSGLIADTEYSYALFAHDGAANFGPVATITLHTTRVGVTGLVATSVTRTSVALAWTNPVDASFSGAEVRRAVGTTPPASITDGTLVSDVASPENTLVDTGLTAGTEYSYAVFAHDAADHVAGGTPLTITTRSPGTDAVLEVNPLIGTGTNVTQDVSVEFDASQSLAADGTDLVTWSLDYGDGSPVEEFTGPFAPADVLGTTHTFTNPGIRSVTLTITDSGGGTDSVVVAVHVFPAPKVTINTVGSPQAGQPLTFEVHPDTPQGTTNTSYQVIVTGDDNFFVDGEGAPPATFDVTFASGSYTVVLTVTNDADGTATSDPVDVLVP